jgi:hypothetical protein
MSIGIYKITNPNNKVYIGQSVDIESRWDNHTSKSVYQKNTSPLYNSFRKYGVDTHVFEILEICVESKLNERERYWQEYYNAINEGLNQRLTDTDDKSGYLSQSHKQKISSAMIGKNVWCKGVSRPENVKQKISKTKKENPYKFTLEQKNKMSLSSKGQIPWNLGIPQTYEAKKKISNANNGHKHTQSSIELIILASLGRKQSAETKAKRYVSKFCKELSDVEKESVFQTKLKEYNILIKK